CHWSRIEISGPAHSVSRQLRPNADLDGSRQRHAGWPGRRERPHAGPESERRHLVEGGEARGRRSDGLGLVKLDRSKSGRWGPYRKACPPPARHRPGARSARRGDVSPSHRRPVEGSMSRFVSLRRFAVALAAVAVLGLAGPAAAGEEVPFEGILEGEVTRTLA